MYEQQINKILGFLQESEFTNEEKEGYKKKLKALKDVKGENKNLEQSLNLLATVSEKDPEAIKSFFNGIEDVLGAYVVDGAQGVIDKMKQANKDLDKVLA